LVFEPDELSALINAAHKAESVGADALSRDAASAIQKLTYDLGAAIGSAVGESDDHASRIPERSTAPAVTTLGESLLRRKHVRFTYRSMNRDVTDERTVEPYGLFFSSGHWYLAARDTEADAIRTFRVSRIEKLAPNTRKPQSVDYEIPGSVRLAEHANTKGPWELGDEAAEEMIVDVRGGSGASLTARSLGKPVEGRPTFRGFQVRRVDSFVRWIMSFAGEVVPISPPKLLDQYRAVLGATLSRYEAQTPRADV
jgi:predicted DNA-binding transcriptional regulator YafY